MARNLTAARTIGRPLAWCAIHQRARDVHGVWDGMPHVYLWEAQRLAAWAGCAGHVRQIPMPCDRCDEEVDRQ